MRSGDHAVDVFDSKKRPLYQFIQARETPKTASLSASGMGGAEGSLSPAAIRAAYNLMTSTTRPDMITERFCESGSGLFCCPRGYSVRYAERSGDRFAASSSRRKCNPVSAA